MNWYYNELNECNMHKSSIACPAATTAGPLSTDDFIKVLTVVDSMLMTCGHFELSLSM